MEAEMQIKSIYDLIRDSLNKAISDKDSKSVVANNIRLTLIKELSMEMFGKEPYEL